jgi:hypothetical protein
MDKQSEVQKEHKSIFQKKLLGTIQNIKKGYEKNNLVLV